MSDSPKESHKGHRIIKDGRGAKNAKKTKLDKKNNNQPKKHNSRAFTVSGIRKTQRNIQRNSDKAHQKEYVPSEHDRRIDPNSTFSAESTDAPPFICVVMGPPGVGKSTLIRSLTKMYTNYNLASIVGPVTCVASKKRRVTFVECPNTPEGMLDCAKVADLVLLVVDAKFGFEMETFEFLNVLQVSGFPKVMGVLTHLDQFRTAKSLRQTKKDLKQRFWTEIYQGAKVSEERAKRGEARRGGAIQQSPYITLQHHTSHRQLTPPIPPIPPIPTHHTSHITHHTSHITDVLLQRRGKQQVSKERSESRNVVHLSRKVPPLSLAEHPPLRCR